MAITSGYKQCQTYFKSADIEEISFAQKHLAHCLTYARGGSGIGEVVRPIIVEHRRRRVRRRRSAEIFFACIFSDEEALS